MYDPTKPYRHQLLELCRPTWETDLVSVKQWPHTPYPEIDPKFLSHVGVDHTDGIGTKGIFHWKKRTFFAAAQDALAMNLNDLAMARSRAYAMQNHIILPEDDRDAILEIVKWLANLCIEYKIALTGGETSIMNNLKGMDLSVSVRGIREMSARTLIVGNHFRAGDVLVGIASNGLHSNGFTKVRKVLGSRFRSDYVVPTRIYWREVHQAQKKYWVNGMSHVTGGAFTKMKDFLQEVDAVIARDHSLIPHSIFQDIYKKGVPDEEMYRTFNCGIGFVLSVRPGDHDAVVKEVGGEVIGRVEKGSGMVRISSMFSGTEVTL